MDDLVGIGDDAHAEKNLLCEFNDCEKRYSTEHSRRQHYRYGLSRLPLTPFVRDFGAVRHSSL